MYSSIREAAKLGKERIRKESGFAPFTPSREGTTHELNHQRRRCLHGKTACELFHDPALRRSFTRRFRDELLRLLTNTFRENLQSMAHTDHHPAAATLWRRTVESWLRCQGLIRVSHKPKTNQPVSTSFPKNWSQN